MAGLVPPNAQAIAQILVQYISSTGACVIDLPAVAPALSICSSIEIRLKPQDVIEQYFDSICIAPTPAEPKPSGIKDPHPARPPTNEVQISPWRTKGSPRVLEDVVEDECNDGDFVAVPMPNDPGQIEPLPKGPVQERPGVPQPPLTTLTPTPTPPTVYRPLAPPVGIGGNSSSVLTSSRHLSSSLSSTPSPSPTSSPSSSRPLPTTTPSSEPQLPTLTKVLSSSSLIPPPSSSHSSSHSSSSSSTTSSSPSPTPTAPVRFPQDDPPKPSPPAGPDPPSHPEDPPLLPPATTYPPPPPPPPPAPVDVPDPCESAYTSINVSDISDVNRNSYDQYLHLVGMDLAQHHGTTQTEAEETVVHEFRVRCDADLPEGPAPVFPDLDSGTEYRRVTEGHRGCLEMCEREAILKADHGLLHECLGVAYRDNPDVLVGEGECRYWSGDKNENTFLPVNGLPSKSGKGDRWQILYM